MNFFVCLSSYFIFMLTIFRLNFLQGYRFYNGLIRNFPFSGQKLKSISSPGNQKPCLVNRVVKTLERLQISSKSTLLLCVSAGSDSMALLHIMKSIQSNVWKELDLKIINFNHKARPESNEEALFVQAWGKKYGLEVFLREFPRELDDKANFQQTARDWRRNESVSLLQSFNNTSKYIVTAHHKEDQLETIFLKLLRGTFISHISGMAELSGSLLRPCLDIRKDELKQYLQENGYEWREDSSNEKRIYQRNKIRLDLMPLLVELSGGFEALNHRLLSLSRQSQELQSFLDLQTELYRKQFHFFQFSDIFILQRPKNFSSIHRLVLSQIIHTWVQTSVQLTLDSFLLEAAVDLFLQPLEGKKTKSLTISPEKDLLRVGEELRIINRKRNMGFHSESILFHDDSSQITIRGNLQHFQIDRIDNIQEGRCKNEVQFLLPTHQSYQIRYIQDGDRFLTKKKHVVDVLRGLSIPLYERDRVIGIFALLSSSQMEESSRIASILLYPTKDADTGEYSLSVFSPIQESADPECILCQCTWLELPKIITCSNVE